jgi:hypothetical protein
MTLIFLPAMYAIWFRIRPERPADAAQRPALHPQGNSPCRTWARHAVRPGPGQRQAGKDTGTA